MNLQDAEIKAASPMQAANGSTNSTNYAIPFDYAEDAKSMVGKTLKSKANTNALKIVKWIGQNYVVQINGTDEYSVTPVMNVLQNISKFIVE